MWALDSLRLPFAREDSSARGVLRPVFPSPQTVPDHRHETLRGDGRWDSALVAVQLKREFQKYKNIFEIMHNRTHSPVYFRIANVRQT